MQAHQSHQAESSLCRRVQGNASFLRTIHSLSVALHEALLARSYFGFTGEKLRQRGTFTLLFKYAPKRTYAAALQLRRRTGAQAQIVYWVTVGVLLN